MRRGPLDLGQLLGGDFKPLQQLWRRCQRLTALRAQLADQPLGEGADQTPSELVLGNATLQQLLHGIERIGGLQADDDEILVVGKLHELAGEVFVDQIARHDRAGVFEHGSLERRQRRLAGRRRIPHRLDVLHLLVRNAAVFDRHEIP